MAAGLQDTYVVHGAETTCDMGLRTSILVLRKCHGVYLKGQAQVTVKDKEGTTNVVCFGGCVSPENPDTVKVAKDIALEVKTQTGIDFEEEVMDIFTCDGEGGKKVMECAGKCIPEIVSVKWDKEKEDVSVTVGKNALLGEATLTCKYGGIIKVTLAGQPEPQGM